MSTAARTAEGPGRREAEARATREALIDAALELFTQRGYASVGTEEIVSRAKVTRGALYHHFDDKRDLFRAVFERVEADLMERIGATMQGANDSWDLIVGGMRAFLDACEEPAVKQISLTDAPAVLGWEAWHESDVNFGLELLQRSIEMAIEGGTVAKQPVEPLSHLLLGALNGSGLEIARSSDPARAKREMRKATDRLLAGLRPR